VKRNLSASAKAATREIASRSGAFGDAAYMSASFGGSSGKQARFANTDPLGGLSTVLDNAIYRQENKAALKRAQSRDRLITEMVMGPPKECPKCKEYEARDKDFKKKFFMETEHLRRGVNKLVDQLANYMSQTQLSQFKSALQLDVRFLTEHADEDGGKEGRGSDGKSPVNKPDPQITYLRDKVKHLEEEIQYQKEQNMILRAQIKKAEKNELGIGGPAPLGGGGGGPAAVAGGSSAPAPGYRPNRAAAVVQIHEQTQTDPWMPPQPHPGAPPAAHGGPAQYAHPGAPGQPAPMHQGPSGGGGQHAKGPTAGPAYAPVGGGGYSGIDPEEMLKAREDLERVTGERDLMTMKLAKAERELKNLQRALDAAKTATATAPMDAGIREEVRENPREEVRRERVQEVGGRLGISPTAAAGPAAAVAASGGVRRRPAAGSSGVSHIISDDESEEHEETQPDGTVVTKRRLKETLPDGTVVKKGGTRTSSFHPPEERHSLTEGGGRRSITEEGQRRIIQEESTIRMKPPVEMVDKCVGGGPPQPEDDEPLLLRGKGPKKKEPEQLNKHGRTHMTSVRSAPGLGIGCGTVDSHDSDNARTRNSNDLTAQLQRAAASGELQLTAELLRQVQQLQKTQGPPSDAGSESLASTIKQGSTGGITRQASKASNAAAQRPHRAVDALRKSVSAAEFQSTRKSLAASTRMSMTAPQGATWHGATSKGDKGLTWHTDVAKTGLEKTAIPQQKFRVLGAPGSEPEPYIMNVWDSHPHGSSDGMRAELLNMGAVMPRNSRAGSGLMSPVSPGTYRSSISGAEPAVA